MTFFYKLLLYAFIAVCVIVSPIAFSTIACFISSLVHGKKIPKKQAIVEKAIGETITHTAIKA